jgi:hypothetical protein
MQLVLRKFFILLTSSIELSIGSPVFTPLVDQTFLSDASYVST